MSFAAGEGTADISPPVGIELAGFHKPPGQERRVTGQRQSASARALVLRAGKQSAAIVSLEICAVSADFARRLQKRAAKLSGIPAANIRVCATHTHSMPTLRYFRQWGAVSPEYAALVEERAAQAVALAQQDLADANLYLGREKVVGGNFNRTTKTWRTDAEFARESRDNERWLDTQLHALYLLRDKPKTSLLWYHFSAHPVCYTDGQAGPDWPGLVSQKTLQRDGMTPAYLQGHCGDVNPGPGTPWLGEPGQVSEAVYSALHHASGHSQLVEVHDLRWAHSEVQLPFDLARFRAQTDLYRQTPEKCKDGEWVDAGFAGDWYASAAKWPAKRTHLAAPISALRLGQVALLFHPAELYSYYGLRIRLDSPFPQTLVVGYTDDFIGYLTDPKAYEANEYAAIVVPKIVDFPPFKPEAAQVLAAAAGKLLHQIA